MNWHQGIQFSPSWNDTKTFIYNKYILNQIIVYIIIIYERWRLYPLLLSGKHEILRRAPTSLLLLLLLPVRCCWPHTPWPATRTQRAAHNPRAARQGRPPREPCTVQCIRKFFIHSDEQEKLVMMSFSLDCLDPIILFVTVSFVNAQGRVCLEIVLSVVHAWPVWSTSYRATQFISQ